MAKGKSVPALWNTSWMLELIVGHWDAIENGVQRVRDVTFGEDAYRIGRR